MTTILAQESMLSVTRIHCPIDQVILRTTDLQKLNKAQLRLLLMLGHAANEMSAFYRAAYAAAMDASHDADLITRQIARAQTLLMLRMAASKMHKIIKITQKDHEYRQIIEDTYVILKPIGSRPER